MFSENADYLEEQFRRWQKDRNSVEPTCKSFFAGMEFSGWRPVARLLADLRVKPALPRLVYWCTASFDTSKHTDPLATAPSPLNPLAALEHFGLSESDLDRTVDASMIFGRTGMMVLRDLVGVA